MLSEAQRATTEFLKLSAPLRESAAEFNGQGLALYTGALIESLSLFGESDKYARQGERRLALKVQEPRAQVAGELAKGRNEQGRKRLGDAKAALKTLRKELRESYADAQLSKEQLDDFYDECKEALVEGDLAAAELKEIDEVLRTTIKAAREGPPALADHLDRETTRLERIRRSGRKGNPIPPWKLAAIILIVGVAIFAFLHCTIFGCSASRNAYIAAFTVLGLIALFC